MKYLNLGCGSHYSVENEWTNLDFVSSGENVISHNLLQGVPFGNDMFDAVYHSHVLEHFSKEEGERFVAECFRVLRPGGILRIAIPDLEQIARKYLFFLEKGMNNLEDEMVRANYEWMKMEMYDQAVRNSTAGNMIKYLQQDKIINEEFVFERIGQEGREIRLQFIGRETKNPPVIKRYNLRVLLGKLKRDIKMWIYRLLDFDKNKYAIGSFRLGGEIHQWMYDRYSLTRLLQDNGGDKIVVRNAFESYIPNWASYNIDGKANIVRKPDSLFVECIKI